MRKNRMHIQYVGAVAAALLAAAPLAATAVTAITGPAVVQADAVTSPDYQRGQAAGAADAAAWEKPASPSTAQDFYNGYEQAYEQFFNGFAELINDQTPGHRPQVSTDPYFLKGYEQAEKYVPQMNARITGFKNQLAQGTPTGWTRQSDDAVRDAIRDAESSLNTIRGGFNGDAATSGLVDFNAAYQKVAAAVLTPRAAAYNPNNAQDKQAEIAAGTQAGRADSGWRDHADNGKETADYQAAYDAAFYGTTGKTAGEQAAIAFQPLPGSFPNKTATYITSFTNAYRDAAQGVHDGTVAYLMQQPADSHQGDDTSYTAGFMAAYYGVSSDQASTTAGTAAGLKAAQNNQPKAMTIGGQNPQTVYNFAYSAAYDDYKAGFTLGAADTNGDVAERTTNQAIIPANTFKGPDFILGYHAGYQQTTDAAQAALRQVVADANTAINSDKYQDDTTLESVKTDITDAINFFQGAHAGSINRFVTSIRNRLNQLTLKNGSATTTPAPEFGFTSQFTKNPTITVGTAFDPTAGISAWTDSSHGKAIPASDWRVAGSVDTGKAGTYTLTYTITNAQGQTATLTRTVTVQAAGALTEAGTAGVVYVTNASGAAMYSDNATSNALGRTLANGTAWKSFGVVKNATGTIVAYNLGGKQYVKAADVTTTPVATQKGVFTVRYPAHTQWAIAVYNSSLQVRKLIKARSAWQTFGTKTLSDGRTYFNLGGNQWVRTDYGYWHAQ